MKKSIILSCLLLETIFLFGQSYRPFNLKDGQWFCRYYTKGGMFYWHGTVYAIDSVRFYCNGDTVINDTAFKKLCYEGYTSSDLIPKKYISGYYGAIRNDTINKKVYLGLIPIYDFNIRVGDTLFMNLAFPVSVEMHVKISSIDSVNYCDKYFKRYNYLDNENSMRSIIEGIGSSDGLFPVYCQPWYSKLICYSEQNNDYCESCAINFTGIRKKPQITNDIIVSQSDNLLGIRSKNIIRSIEVYDISGKLVSNYPQVNANSIYFKAETKGILLIKVKIGSEVITKKCSVY